MLKHRTWIFCVLSVLLLILSFSLVPQRKFIERDTHKLERKIQERQAILEKFAIEALNYPVNEWLDLPEFPEDMVIYKYNADTIQSWINEFPIGNDEVDVLPLWYRIHYLNSRSLYNNQLAYIGENAQFVNLGYAWYIVKVYSKERVKIIAGLLIKSDLPASNNSSKNQLNPKFHIKRNLSLQPTNFEDGFIVQGKDGEVLFSVVDDIINQKIESANMLRWLAVLFAALALYSFHYGKRKLSSFFLFFIGLTLLRLYCFKLGNQVRSDMPLFSPNLYADRGVFSSFGDLLLNNLYMCAIAIGAYMMRRRFILSYKKWSKPKRVYAICAWVLLIVTFVLYIHFTLRSLVINSTITLELYNLEGLTIYTFLAYLSYVLLFLSLLLLLQFMFPVIFKIRKNSLLTLRNILIFTFLASIYTLITVGYLSFEKEKEKCKVWSNKLSVERDLNLELKLPSIEKSLVTDPIIRTILEMPEKNSQLLQSRMSELYLQDITQKYEVNLTICRANDALIDSRGQKLVDCNGYFENVVMQFGTPVTDGSNFFFMNNFNGRISYLGILRYLTSIGQVSLYIQMDSRYTKDVLGYPSLFFDYKEADNVNMPLIYSYGKYVDNRLLLYRGRYNYSTNIDDIKVPDGFSISIKDNYRHFINKLSGTNVIIVSRPQRNFFPYLFAFSYLMLFYSAIIIFFLRLRKLRKKSVKLQLPKQSIRRKITYLITTTLVFSLICMGFGSVWFSINYYKESNRINMEEKLQSVQTTFTDFCKYAEQYNDINSPDFFQAMDRLANNVQVDINLYDPYGRLIRSTKSELFENYMLPSRMNSSAFYQIITEKKRQVINHESIGDIGYTSLYAPIFNNAGKLITIANIPYFTKNSDLRGNISSIVAAIINVYILLIIAAIFGGTMLSNSVSKPLAEISKKMKLIDVSKRAEHINYRNKDELGMLVATYNKMVDDLEESTAQLAQTEREHAWSEMARQIAHEIKNPLTPMRLSIQHLIRLKKQGVDGWENKFEEVANSILEQIEILSNTASEFSSFAKFYYEERQIINLYELIVEQKILFDTRDNVKIIFDYNAFECPVFVRKGQIIRVVVNLLSNAIQAVEEIGHGYVRISLKELNGEYKVSFEDNGNGVKDSDICKLFKPNFTTKSGGTGLGLAISRNIIEQSGGHIAYCKSELGGADFSFTLPYKNSEEQEG